eukprot:COSAG02_NODE_765_length_17396_cov_16.796786_15_plen_56_part_00
MQRQVPFDAQPGTMSVVNAVYTQHTALYTHSLPPLPIFATTLCSSMQPRQQTDNE